MCSNKHNERYGIPQYSNEDDHWNHIGIEGIGDPLERKIMLGEYETRYIAK